MIIRRFKEKDAESTSNLIIETMRKINVKDYSEELIEGRIHKYTPDAIIEKSKNSIMLLAEEDGEIVGTAALKGNEVRTMFVKWDYIGKGIGRELLEEIENIARAENLKKLFAGSSLTAVGFYEKYDYKKVREIKLDDGSMIILMEKEL